MRKGQKAHCSKASDPGGGGSNKGSRGEKNGRIYGAVILVAVGCYLNSLGGEFVHDDIPAVVQNKDVLGKTSLIDVFKNDFWGMDMSDYASHKSYRPITVLTFRANYWVFGLRPIGFHAFNIGLHVAATLLFTRICLGISGLEPKFAAAAGALFAAHPIHTEAVSGIVGRADVLACVFFLLSFLCYHGKSLNTEDAENSAVINKNEINRISSLSIWLSIILGGLSMLAKETGVSVMVVNLLYDFYRSWPSIKRTLVEIRWNEDTLVFARRAAKVLISLCLMLVFRLALLQGSLPRFSVQDNPTAFHPNRNVRFMTFCYLAAFNLWLLLCPITLSHDWQMGSIPLITSFTDYRNLFTCIFAIAFGILLYRGFSDFDKQRHPALLLGIFFLVLPFLPAANLLVTVGFVIAERVLFIPSLGFVLLVVYGAQQLWSAFLRQRSFLLCAGLFVILMAYCGRCVVRNADWSCRESLVKSGLRVLPSNAKMHYNFANFLRDTGQTDKAILHYKEALRLWPTYASAHNNLGTLVGLRVEAEEHFLAAIRHAPSHVNAHYNLGQIYRRANRTEESLHMLRRCLVLDAAYVPAYLLLSKLYSNLDGVDDGLADVENGRYSGPERRRELVGSLLRHVNRLVPGNPESLSAYANWLNEGGRYWEGLQFYLKAVSAAPDHIEALIGTARTLRGKGHVARARQFYKRAMYPTRRYYSVHDYSAIFAPSGQLFHLNDDQDPMENILTKTEPQKRTNHFSKDTDHTESTEGIPAPADLPYPFTPNTAAKSAKKKRRDTTMRGRDGNGTRDTASKRDKGTSSGSANESPCAAPEAEGECMPVVKEGQGGGGGTTASFNQVT